MRALILFLGVGFAFVSPLPLRAAEVPESAPNPPAAKPTGDPVEAPASDVPPDVRLLRAEILEVSAGDVEQAIARYRQIIADAASPAPVRGRALLALGRAQRKLGDLDSARKALEEVLRDFPLDPDLAPKAKSYLRELQSGKAENPSFDWLSRLQENPEIQSRVFELAMDLVDPATEAGKRAAGQLLALGSIALPMLEKLIETSRDPSHRERLALIAVQAGRLERLDVLLGSREPDPILYGVPTPESSRLGHLDGLGSFVVSVVKFPPEERKRVLDALAAIRVHEAARPYADAIRLFAGDPGDPAVLLPSMEKGRVFTRESVEALLAFRPELAPVLASRVIDPAVDQRARSICFDSIEKTSPALLGPEHWKALVGSLEESENAAARRLEALAKRGDLETFIALAPAKARLAYRIIFQGGSGKNMPTQSPFVAAGTARVLVALLAPESTLPKGERDGVCRALRFLADGDDTTLPAFEDFLRRRQELAPDVWNYGHIDESWRPSPAFADAMARFLESPDPFAVATALEGLALAPRDVGPDILPQVKKLLADGETPSSPGKQPQFLRDLALHAIACRLSTRPETGPEVARLLLDEASRVSDALIAEDKDAGASESKEIQGQLGALALTIPALAIPGGNASPVRLPSRPGITRLTLRRPGPMQDGGKALYGRHTTLLPLLSRVKASTPHAVLPRSALLEAVTALPPSETKLLLVAWVWREVPSTTLNEMRPAALVEILCRLVADPAPEAYLEAMVSRLPESSDNSGPFFEAIAREARIPHRLRMVAALRASVAEAFDWIAWPDLLQKDATAAVQVLGTSTFEKWFESLPSERSRPILEAFAETKDAALREWAAERLPDDLPDLLSTLGVLSGDSVRGVREAAAKRIALRAQRNSDGAALAIGLLAGEFKNEEWLHEALKVLAAPETIAPLSRLLDDPDIQARNRTLETLKAIRDRIGERAEWRKASEAGGAVPSPPAP